MTGRAEIGSMDDFGNAHIAVVQTVFSMAQFFSANTAIHLFKQLVQFGTIHCRHLRQLREGIHSPRNRKQVRTTNATPINACRAKKEG